MSPPQNTTQQRQRQRIVVPQRAIQGGFDMKFETDPYNIELYNMLTPTQYTDAIQQMNDTMAPSRSKKFDGLLLAAGPLLVPLALWGIRHSNQNRRRKKLRTIAINNVNTQYPTLYMRWNRKPQSKLTIERRVLSSEEQQAQIISSQQGGEYQGQDYVPEVMATPIPPGSTPPRISRQQRQGGGSGEPGMLA